MAKIARIQSPIKVITSGNTPTTANLAVGELAVGKCNNEPIIYANIDGSIVPLTSSSGGSGSAKEELFRDIWNDACGSYGCYNADTGYYELNGITDITYEEAIAILRESGDAGHVSSLAMRHLATKVRTLLPLKVNATTTATAISAQLAFANSALQKVVMLQPTGQGGDITATSGKIYLSNVTAMFSNCQSLREIDAVIQLTTGGTVNAFNNCHSLEKVKILAESPNTRINLSMCSKLRWESIYYSVYHGNYANTLEISFHNDVREKLERSAVDSYNAEDGWSVDVCTLAQAQAYIDACNKGEEYTAEELVAQGVPVLKHFRTFGNGLTYAQVGDLIAYNDGYSDVADSILVSDTAGYAEGALWVVVGKDGQITYLMGVNDPYDPPAPIGSYAPSGGSTGLRICNQVMWHTTLNLIKKEGVNTGSEK